MQKLRCGLKHTCILSGDCSKTLRRDRQDACGVKLYSFIRRKKNPTYLFPHDISGLHDAARGQAMVSGQQDGLLQCHTQGAAVGWRGKHKVKLQHTLPVCIFIRFLLGAGGRYLSVLWANIMNIARNCSYLSSYFPDAALSQHAVCNCHKKNTIEWQ